MTRAIRPEWAILAGAAVCAVLLAAPGQTVTTRYLNDLLIFLDGAHRIASGQVPNRDFHTALGPIAFYIPALGYRISGSFGAAMPTGVALALLVLAPVVAWVVGSRLRPALAIPFGALLIVVLAQPMNLGEDIGSLSFAMFYNRIGWVALATLLTMYVPPPERRPRHVAADAICAAALTLLMLYTKVTYGIVAIGFLAFMLADAPQRKWAGAAVVLTGLCALAGEFVWGATLEHVADLQLARRVSGWPDAETVRGVVLLHLPDLCLLGLFTGLLVASAPRLRHGLFVAGCVAGGLAIATQNSQAWGILSLQAGAAGAAELFLRANAGTQKAPLGVAIPLLFLATVFPPTVQGAGSLALHAAVAVSGVARSIEVPNLDGVRVATLWSAGEHDLVQAQARSLREGTDLLARVATRPERVTVLDFANGFSAALGLPPPRGDSAWLHWGRNVNATHHVPGEELFADATIVMAPKWGVNPEPLLRLYGPALARNFDVLEESTGWIVYQRSRVSLSGVQPAEQR